MGSHLLRVDPAERIHLLSRARVRREQQYMREHNPLLPLAHRRTPATAAPALPSLLPHPGLSGSVAGAAAVLRLLLPSEVVEREIRCGAASGVRPLRRSREAACGPLGVGSVLVPTCNGAKDESTCGCEAQTLR
jgi:hypothetical protein